MAKGKVPVTFAFGRRDRVDPKLAPFGVLKTGRNLRLRKDGRLGTRHGYQPVEMTTANGTLRAFDIHEYKGRLLALGSDGGDGYPTDIFEHTGFPGRAWRASDRYGRRVTLNPFTRAREVAGIPQLDADVADPDVAAGGGYVCFVYRNVNHFAVIVDADTDQVIHVENLGAFAPGVAATRWTRVVYAGGKFYVAFAGIGGAATTVHLLQYAPGDAGFATFATVTPGPTSADLSALDLVPVTNATTARVAVACDQGTFSDLTLRVFDANGSQLGSTITIVADPRHLSIDADQADNTINILAIDLAGTGLLRTYNFAGTLLDGPTAVTVGTRGYICRLPAAPGFNEHLAVAVNDASSNIVVQFWDLDAHTLTGTTTIQRAFITGRPVSGQSATQNLAIALPALVGPDFTTFIGNTNALFFVTPDVAHLSTRDIGTARHLAGTASTRQRTLALDASRGRLAWLALRDPGTDIDHPVITLVDFQSAERRHAAAYGSLLYFAGATPSVYDGRFCSELQFNERPFIVSATPVAGGSALGVLATYQYVVHWEFVLADGSVLMSPVSAPVSVTLGSGQRTVNLVVSTPHSVRSAMGDAVYGADVLCVVSRTYWDTVTQTQDGLFRRCVVSRAGSGMSRYGRTVTISDGSMTDADLLDNESVYTQADRGVNSAPLVHFAPQACTYVAATEARLLHAGLAREHEVQVSKPAYLGEPFAFSPQSQFFAQASGPVVGVRRLDGARLLFTDDSILVLTGDGPDDIGAGELPPPAVLPTPGGLYEAWSFLEGPDGLWFQMAAEKLFRVPRGGGSPTWEGVDVEDTLASYPVITGAGKHRGDNAGLFACNSVERDEARILVRDFRTEQWLEDEPVAADGYGIEAMAPWGETVAYVTGGVVYAQSLTSFDDGDGDFIAPELCTHPLYPFGLGGYGEIYEMLLTGEYRGDCVLEARVSYDDGQSFVPLVTFDLLAADGLSLGQTVQRKYTLPQDITSSIVVEVSVTTAGGPSEGFVFNQIDLLVEAEEGLRELAADEMG